MNRLTIIKVVAWLRREPFAVSSIPVVDDMAVAGSGELLASLPATQVPARELDIKLWTSKALMGAVVEFLRSHPQLAEQELPAQ